MNFKDFTLNPSYKSVGEVTISDIVNPLLKTTMLYQRSVGFFSSSALDFISDGLIALANNGGHVQLATSPKLSENDIEAIQNGYSMREILENSFINEFRKTITDLECDKLELLSNLIANKTLDIKIVCKPNGGMYHDKLALLTDFDDNKIAFVGSSNESKNGYDENYEKVRVFKSWFEYEGIIIDSDIDDRIADETKEFLDIWKDNNKFLKVYNFEDAIKRCIIEVKNSRNNNPGSNKPVYDLRDYQIEAINSWVDNGYNGFYEMATGTGKTITALYSIKKLIDTMEVFTVIAVPYIHLVTQWYEDAKLIFPNCDLIKCYSGNPNWTRDAASSIFLNRGSEKKKNIILFITLASLSSQKYDNVLRKVNCPKILLVDEAHNFINKLESKYKYEYMLGLSATPVFGKNMEKTNKLLNYFGGKVYSLPIENAIGKHLVNYEYIPIYSSTNEDEEKKFKKYSSQMAACYENGVLVDVDTFIKVHKNRLRVISMTEDKIESLNKYIQQVKSKEHFIIYCSDGKVFSDNENKRHIKYATDILNNMGYKPSKFTADESMDERISLIENFNEGYISTLVAIKCLDEGVNIPSIESALILSSNDNYREFVQRRGRILRKYKNKSVASIYDVIVLPSYDCPEIAKIELRRFYEYARLAVNKDELIYKLEKLLSEYNLTYDDISFDYISEENDIIEGEQLDEKL